MTQGCIWQSAEHQRKRHHPFRYCGEYYDAETGNYYLRARYYDPGVGRFTQQDTHWNTGNMIYGDSDQTLIPQTLAIKQAGNLYAYCANDPVSFADYSGNAAKAVAVRYDDNKSTALHIDVFGAMAFAGLTLTLNKLLADDSPILYAKKGTKGASNSKSAVAMGGASPASPDPDDDEFNVEESTRVLKQKKKLSPEARESYDSTVQRLRQGEWRFGNNHSLSGGRAGQWAIDIKHMGHGRGAGRIIFEIVGSSIKIIEIIFDHSY